MSGKFNVVELLNCKIVSRYTPLAAQDTKCYFATYELSLIN